MRRPRSFIGPGAMGGMVSLWGASSLIRSIQRGTVTLSSGNVTATATISAVDLPNTRLVWLGNTMGSNNLGWDSSTARITLTNATTITATRIASAGAGSLIVGFEVIEYAPGFIKSIQRLNVTSSGGGATVTAVDMSKSFVDFLGWSCADTSVGANQVVETPRIVLQSTVLVNSNNGNGDTNSVSSFQLVELY